MRHMQGSVKSGKVSRGYTQFLSYVVGTYPDGLREGSEGYWVSQQVNKEFWRSEMQ
jgi:hypothetical protein